LLAAVLVALVAGPAVPDDPKPLADPPAKADAPWYVDDDEFFAEFMDRLRRQARRKRGLPHDQLVAKRKPGPVGIAPVKPGERVLSPEELYRHALPSVFVLGSVYRDAETGEWEDGMYATAWALTADGVLVTNWHTFEDLMPGEVFGAVDHKGRVYPLVDFLGGDKTADIAVVKVGGSGFTPLPVATAPAAVGSRVGVLGHPGDSFFVFTQGHVSRYSKNRTDDDQVERWMSVTADYAGGSSGSPVLDRTGAVVGMAAMTITLDSGDGRVRRDGPARHRPRLARKQPAQFPIAPPPRPKDDPKVLLGPAAVQMVVKMTVPAESILKVLGPK
jgi:S1-C subfamily serine protease